jgi:cold shock CspA family protein
MQTRAKIEFEGVAFSSQLESWVGHHLDKLEKLYGRIVACGVIVRDPGGRHQNGGLYDVRVRLTLPERREVVVDRTPGHDERYSDLKFAIDDAFRRARRQLQDEARRMRGQIKHHEKQPIAEVASIDPSGEFGFLRTDDGQEIYFHRNSALDGMPALSVGARVAFVEEAGEKGPQASTVKLMRKHRLRA